MKYLLGAPYNRRNNKRKKDSVDYNYRTGRSVHRYSCKYPRSLQYHYAACLYEKEKTIQPQDKCCKVGTVKYYFLVLNYELILLIDFFFILRY